MLYAVTDIEATCCDWKEDEDAPFPKEEIEVIQWSTIVCNSSGEVVSSFNIYIQPTLNPKLTLFCERLTGITNEFLIDMPQRTFKEAVVAFNEAMRLHNDDVIFCSWGGWDAKHLKMESERNGIEAPKILRQNRPINLKKMFSRKQKCSFKGIEKALERVGLEFKGKRHNALDDALNTSRLLPFCKLSQVAAAELLSSP